MVRKKSMKGDYCPSARALDVIGDWWSLLIVREAFDGVTRFSAFQKNLGIARNILSERLRKLTGEGIMESVPDPNGGAHQEYRLTAKGAICCLSSCRSGNGEKSISLRRVKLIRVLSTAFQARTWPRLMCVLRTGACFPLTMWLSSRYVKTIFKSLFLHIFLRKIGSRLRETCFSSAVRR